MNHLRSDIEIERERNRIREMKWVTERETDRQTDRQTDSESRRKRRGDTENTFS